MMRTALYYCVVMAAMAASLAAGPPRTTFEVKYISAEAVYLDGGADDGLEVGDRLTITGKDSSTVELEVVFVAQHSVSCRVLGRSGDLAVGLTARLTAKAQAPTLIKDTLKVDTTQMMSPKDSSSGVRIEKQSYVRPPATKISGNLSFVFYNWNDHSPVNFDFRQSTVRLVLRARRLWGKGFTFALRSRGQYDQRPRTYSSLVARNVWENRVWEFSFGYEEPSAPLNFVVGRVLPQRVSSVGYLDGLLVETPLSGHVRFGAFGGTEPDWLYGEGQVPLMKGGAYVSCVYGSNNNIYFEQSIAGVGAYHRAEVSREFISLQGRLSVGSRWGLSNMADIDFNRSWRKEKTGRALSLTNIYLSSYYRIASALRVSVSYNSLRNVWTLETKSVVDSLFDDHLRQGAHAQLDITLPLAFSASTSVGYSKRAGDVLATRSYSLYLNKYGLLGRGMTAIMQMAGFTGPLDNGHNYSIRVNENLWGGSMLGLAYGVYLYKVAGADASRSNRWLEMSAQTNIGIHTYVSGLAQFSNGDDINGIRIQTELGYRF